jgi:F420H(2)-dependent quinone reductase
VRPKSASRRCEQQSGDPLRDRTVRQLSRLHRLLFLATRGIVGRRLVSSDMLLLSTTGRRSGRRHTVPLLYLTHEDAVVVIASYGGRPRHPDWYLNLVDRPQADVRLTDRRFPARARLANPVEREDWWPRIVAAYPGYARYQARTSREIPVVFLEPDDSYG